MIKYDIRNIKFSIGDGLRLISHFILHIIKKEKENKIRIAKFKDKELTIIQSC